MIFDGINKRIILTSNYTTASEIWSAWVKWLSDDSTNLQFQPAMKQVGGESLGAGLTIPIYIFLLNDWRVRPMESNHLLIINGNLFVEGEGQPVVNTLGNFNVSVQYTVPVMAIGYNTGGNISGSGLTSEEHNQLMKTATKSDVFNATMII